MVPKHKRLTVSLPISFYGGVVEVMLLKELGRRMQTERGKMSVKDIVDLHKNKMLQANPEYQRGEVWKSAQKKKLIDSVLRGYSLPLFYLHHIKRTVAGMQRDDLEVIDGQQRITALSDFVQGAFKLFDPVADDKEAKFPIFIKSKPCAWGNKDFQSLSEDLKNQLLNTELAVVRIDTEDENEVRDLFVRLQSGLPLNAQETRDALPGGFNEFILKLGGKPQIARYPGHDFFLEIMGMKPGTDRGKTRTLAAQIVMLFLNRRRNGPDSFTDIKNKAVDEFYYTNLDFDQESAEANRLRQILDKLVLLLGGDKRPKVRGHDAIHLLLLVDTLWDDYTRGWEATLPAALDRFMSEFVKSKAKAQKGSDPNEFWTRYGQWTRVNSDRADTIQRRHQFYVERMLEYLQPLERKDPKRGYGALEREIIYFRDNKKCAKCGVDVAWTEAEAHHVKEHHKGGPTVLENAVLVHRHCHPKGAAAEEFAKNR